MKKNKKTKKTLTEKVFTDEDQARFSLDALDKADQRRQNRAKRSQGGTPVTLLPNKPKVKPAALKKVSEKMMTTKPMPIKKQEPPVVRKTPKIGRNAKCPCGSGKKNKKCCNKN